MQGIVSLILVVVLLVSGWKVFEKAGKPGWAIFVPFYNVIVFLQIAGRPWWWLFLMLIPIVNIVIAIIVSIDFVKKFGQPGWHAVLYIFLSFVYLPYLAFTDVEYTG